MLFAGHISKVEKVAVNDTLPDEVTHGEATALLLVFSSVLICFLLLSSKTQLTKLLHSIIQA